MAMAPTGNTGRGDMLDAWLILLISFGYLGVLFAIAYYADRRADSGRSVIGNPYIYTLSIAVYCTAWTFYGSVGRAASTGVGFLPIYLGPTLMAALWWLVLAKIIRIAKVHNITSIADFIGSRYGKSALLGGLVTVIAVVGIMPYISLQLKAVSASFEVVRNYPELNAPVHSIATPVWADSAFYIALLLAAFTIVFGTRHIDVTERHEGMVAAIAFESLVKLVAFLSIGVFVTFVLFDGPAELFAQAATVPELERLMRLEALPGGFTAWLSLTFLSMMAIMFLPRQFQVAVVENVNEDHLRKASWLFPLYLLVINLFVLPIALGGELLFAGKDVDPDTYVLTLPMSQHMVALALFVFIGGLSAATGMVIVATIALSTMVSNDLLMPMLLRIKSLGLAKRRDLTGLLLAIRRGAIVVILLLGYSYFRLIGESYALVTIGLVSFAAAAQFAPAIIAGIYWTGASRAGAISGLVGGFAVWAYTLLLPGFARSGWLPISFLENGPWGISALRPYELFGVEGLDPISHAVFWSMLINVGCLVVVSLFSRRGAMERVQAALFVDVFRQRSGDTYAWAGTTTVGELRALVARFMGERRAEQEFQRFAPTTGRSQRHGGQRTEAHVINFTERLLAGVIGAASARVMVSSVVQGEALSIEGVLEILDETSQIREYSRQLEQKSAELQAATAELKAANLRLQELDRMKDEFVSTVSHELRTPLTSIRAFSEILHGNLDLPRNQRQEFLAIVVKETERLTRLINDLLDIAKIESGRMDWHVEAHDLRDLISEAAASVSQLFRERGVKLVQRLPADPAMALVDRDRLQQVIINLLSNACKFCPEQFGQVQARLEHAEGKLRLTVQDNGQGIPPEHLERVFEKFHQVEEGDGQPEKGTGLGLAICRGIVEHHGGRIWAENGADAGALLVCEMPASGRPRQRGFPSPKVSPSAGRVRLR
ncbi:MAG: ATP-binding protein [Gammaproteobacteria bacterium]|nr:ATP-binding protein [Gammaproteobacteria bacterium]